MKKLNNFLKICLDSADLAENSDPLNNVFLNELRLGIHAYAGYMREGAKGIIDLLNERMRLKSKVEYLESIVKTYEQIANDDDLEYLDNDELGKIKNYIDCLVKEKEARDDTKI